VKRENHGGSFLNLSARSKRETEVKLDGFLVPRWKREGTAMPEGLKVLGWAKLARNPEKSGLVNFPVESGSLTARGKR